MMQPTNAGPATKEESFLHSLRTATAAQHKQLEATKLSAEVLRQDVTAEMYMAYLVHMRGVVAFVEEEVYPRLAHLFTDMHSRCKLPALNSDVGVLAGHVPLPVAKPYVGVLPNGSIGTALGYMYVMEGSTLGGRVLLKHIKSALGFDEENGARFFAGYGSETGILWKHFLAVLTGYAVINECGEDVIAGANHAFSTIEQHFS